MTDPIDNQEISDFQVSKYRLTGAFVWLGLLVIIVPIWYSNPVNFDPTAQTDADASTRNHFSGKAVFIAGA